MQGHVDHERRLSQVEQELQLMRNQQQEATRKLLEVARSSEQLPDETVRMKVLRLVNNYCEATNVGQQQAWRQIYDRLYYLYKVNIRGTKRRSGESWLDVAERCGHMDKIYTIASAELTYG